MREFYATCRYPGHRGCVLTRTGNPSPWKSRAGQGRPLGLLVAWCSAVGAGTIPDKDAHTVTLKDLCAAEGQGARAGSREWFKAQPESGFS